MNKFLIIIFNTAWDELRTLIISSLKHFTGTFSLLQAISAELKFANVTKLKLIFIKL